MKLFAERKIVPSLLFLLGMTSLFYRCGPTKMTQQSPEPDTVAVTAADREIFVVHACDATPNEDGTWNPIDSVTISLLGTDQVRVIDFDTLRGVVYFYDVPEVFTLRATHPDYEPGEVTVDMKYLRRRSPDAPCYGTVIYLKRKK